MKADDFDAHTSFPHPVNALQWRETHISWILLTGKWVYKIKKPVNFGFLDFSTLEKRKHFCEEELRLNARTAAQWYRSVETLSRDENGLNFCGRGEVVDYAVKMQQFNPDALLLQEMQAGTIGMDFVRQLGEDLALFHQQVAVDEQGQRIGGVIGGLDAIRYPVAENFNQIRPLLESAQQQDQLEQLQRWAQHSFEQLRPQLQQRIAQGAIRECHGDLHMGNIAVIDNRALLFDCIEFNERLRWIDRASDLAFLLMDMQFHGYDAQASALLNQYLSISGDYSLLAVLRFYMAYRAMVRAKVSILRLRQADLDPAEKQKLRQQFQDYLAFAQRQRQTPLAPLILTCGVSGTGKSTFARQLADTINAIHLRSDVVRKQLAGLKPLQTSADATGKPNQGIYSPEFSEKTFQQLAQWVELALRNGFPVIVDATFLIFTHRQRFVVIGEQYAQQIIIVHFQVPYAELVKRIQKRQMKRDDASEATLEVLDQQLQRQQGFAQQELPLVVEGYNQAGAFNFAAVLARLKDRVIQNPAELVD